MKKQPINKYKRGHILDRAKKYAKAAINLKMREYPAPIAPPNGALGEAIKEQRAFVSPRFAERMENRCPPRITPYDNIDIVLTCPALEDFREAQKTYEAIEEGYTETAYALVHDLERELIIGATSAIEAIGRFKNLQL